MSPAAKTRAKSISAGFLLVAAIHLAPGPAVATQVRSLNLETMTERADRIFSGRTEQVRVVEDDPSGQLVTQVTFSVDRVVKGDVGPTVTIRLLGDRSRGPSSDWLGLPSFREGEDVVLFLYGDSRLGITSPVGFLQGKFTVIRDKSGRRRALNGWANSGLHSNLSGDARHRLGLTTTHRVSSEAPDPDALLDSVERLMQ